MNGPERADPGRGHGNPELFAEPFPRDCQPDQVRGGRSAHECAGVLRQAEELPDPADGLLLQIDRRGITAGHNILVECAGQPVTCDRRRRRATGDEAEVARARATGEVRFPTVLELRKRLAQTESPFRQGCRRNRILRQRHRTFGDSGQHLFGSMADYFEQRG